MTVFISINPRRLSRCTFIHLNMHDLSSDGENYFGDVDRSLGDERRAFEEEHERQRGEIQHLHDEIKDKDKQLERQRDVIQQQLDKNEQQQSEIEDKDEQLEQKTQEVNELQLQLYQKDYQLHLANGDTDPLAIARKLSKSGTDPLAMARKLCTPWSSLSSPLSRLTDPTFLPFSQAKLAVEKNLKAEWAEDLESDGIADFLVGNELSESGADEHLTMQRASHQTLLSPLSAGSSHNKKRRLNSDSSDFIEEGQFDAEPAITATTQSSVGLDRKTADPNKDAWEDTNNADFTAIGDSPPASDSFNSELRLNDSPVMRSSTSRLNRFIPPIANSPSSCHKRKYDGLPDVLSSARPTSKEARRHSAPLNGLTPREVRGVQELAEAANDIETPESSTDRSSSLDSDAYDSWSASWSTTASDTDERVHQPSPSPDVASLIPRFPFKVFLGTFLDDNDTSTAQTIEFDDLSVEFRQAVIEHTEGWVEKGLEKWKSWDRVVNPHNECVYHKAFSIGTCYWTAIYPRFYTCMTCANMRRMCFKRHGDEVWLLPLPPQVDGDAELGTLGSFVIQHHERKASTKEHRNVWEQDRGEAFSKKADK